MKTKTPNVSGRSAWLRDNITKYFSFSAIIILLVALSLTQDNFLGTSNLKNLLRDTAPLMIMSAGMTMVLLFGSIDLSMGAVCSVSNVTYIHLMLAFQDSFSNPLLTSLAAMAVSLAFGLASGLALGSRTVLSGSVSRSKNDPSQSLQMMERPLMTPDELKSIPKGSFVVMKTGTHPMQTKLRLFLGWGITFGEPYITPEHAARPVTYASRQELFLRIDRAYGKKDTQPTQVQQAPVAERRSPYSAMGLYNEDAKT